MKKRVVIKLSGKLFGTDSAGVLADYAKLLVKISKTCQPIVVAGGGSIARHYINHGRASGADESSLDEMGIEISRLNARLLIYALKQKAYSHPPTTLREVRQAADTGLIVVAGGLHPGQSTNGTAALIAEKTKAARFLNATDVDGVYDMDPKKHKSARRFRQIGLGDLRKILAREDSVAGGYDLMDLIALKIIERSRIETVIMKADIRMLEKAVNGSPVGTRVLMPGKTVHSRRAALG